MSRGNKHYHLVTTLHRANAAVAEARAAHVAAVADLQRATADEASTRAAADAAVVAAARARVAVDTALAGGKLTSAMNILDVPLDCLALVLSHLDPRHALAAARANKTLAEAYDRSGLFWWGAHLDNIYSNGADSNELVAQRLRQAGARPAVRSVSMLWVKPTPSARDVLKAAIDAAPKATELTVGTNAATLSDVADVIPSTRPLHVALSVRGLSPSALYEPNSNVAAALARLVPRVTSLSLDADTPFPPGRRLTALAPLGLSLTALTLQSTASSLPLLPALPALKRLHWHACSGTQFSPLIISESLTGAAAAPAPREFEVTVEDWTGDDDEDEDSDDDDDDHAVKFGDTLFWTALAGVTRVAITLATVHDGSPSLSLRDLAVLTGQDRSGAGVGPPWRRNAQPLRALSVTATSCDGCSGVATVTITGAAISTLTSLSVGGSARLESRLTGSVATAKLAALRLLDLRGASLPGVDASSSDEDDWRPGAEWRDDVGLPFGSAGGLPALETLLAGYASDSDDDDDSDDAPAPRRRGAFNLFLLTALAAPRLRRVVLQRASLHVAMPRSVASTTAANSKAVGAEFGRRLAARVPALTHVHLHDCAVDGADAAACVRALRGGGRVVCRDGGCMVCALLDGKV